MKINLTILAISALVLGSLLLSFQTLFEGASAYERYYIAAALIISSALLIISIAQLLYRAVHRSSIATRNARSRKVQPREHYRLTYDTPPHPLFVQNDDELPLDQTFSCPVKDLSETGLALYCSGVYENGQAVIGEVIFDSGRNAKVNGHVVRQNADSTSIALDCTIEPSVFMAEQRELIAARKQTGPRPTVSQDILDKTADSLPSHRPKGICLKK